MVQSTAQAGRFAFGNLIINPSTYSATVDGVPVDLTFNEFDLLLRFCVDPNRIIDYDALCDALWSSTGARERRRLSVAVCRLRAKLAGSEPYHLDTVRGRGYGLIESHHGTIRVVDSGAVRIESDPRGVAAS